MRVRLSIAALLLAASAGSAFAQANSFALIFAKTGKTIGKASYTIDKVKAGTRVRSKFEYKLGGMATQLGPIDPDKPTATISEVQYTAEFTIDAKGNTLSGYAQNGTTQMMTSFQPNKTRDIVTIGKVQGGASAPSRDVPVPKPDFQIAADYDPAAMQTLLTTVLTTPHADHLYLVLTMSSGLQPQITPLYIAVGEPTKATGQLDGKPVDLKVYPLKWNKAKGDIIATEDGVLMQADNGQAGATYIRNKFTLDPMPKQ
jgi:hypothetical protein